MNRILVSLAVLLALAAPGFAGDGDLAVPPAAHGRKTQATIGHECSSYHPDPCKQTGIAGGAAKCEDGEWVCEGGCTGGPPPCAAGKSGQCVNNQWQCVITDGCQLEILCKEGTHRECQGGQNVCVADPACTGTPQCGLVLRPVCVHGSWECWTPGGSGTGSADPQGPPGGGAGTPTSDSGRGDAAPPSSPQGAGPMPRPGSGPGN